jgi:hypothetical protein
MNKNLFFVLIIAGLCFGQNVNKSNKESKIAVGVMGGLNYALYYFDRWGGPANSAPRINIGINSEFKLTSHLSNIWELSYLQLFFNRGMRGYIYDSVSYSEHYSFDNFYFSSALDISLLRNGLFTPNVIIGLAVIWPFSGIREEYFEGNLWKSHLIPYAVANCSKGLFLLGAFSLEINKCPFKVGLFRITLDGNYGFIRTYPVSVCDVRYSIPIEVKFALLFKL